MSGADYRKGRLIVRRSLSGKSIDESIGQVVNSQMATAFTWNPIRRGIDYTLMFPKW